MFISYNGMLDPLGQSQVIPYLRELAKRGASVTLLSFERDSAFDDEGKRRCLELRSQLALESIDWHWLRYHQRPSLPATVYDVLAGTRYAQRLVRKHRIEMVHARSHIPATIGLALKRRFGIKMIFDIRGLMAEEYLDADHWSEQGIPFRLTKKMERRMLAKADAVVTLTKKIWPVIREWPGLRGRDVVHEVIPCCADLEKFKFSESERIKRRDELGLRDRFVLVYSGSIGGWYQSDKMADFFVRLLKERPDAYFLWLTTGDAAIVEKLMKGRGVSQNHYSVKRVESAEVSSFLSAADAGIAFYKPGFSKLATSPVKVTEYLACGLPFVINSGIGDSDRLATDEGVGSLVHKFEDAEYDKSIKTILDLSARPEETRARSRAIAEKFFSLEGVGGRLYARLYERVLGAESAE